MKTQCPNCKSKFNVNETNVGKQAKCPKCAKPFTIEPFIETPAAVKQPAKGPEPVSQPAKSSDVVPPVKISAPAEPPVPTATPVKSPEPIAPVVKSPQPVTTPVITVQQAQQEKPESKTQSKEMSKTALSKTVFVYCWMTVRIIAGILGTLGLILAIQKGAKSTLIMTFAAADVFLVCSMAIELTLFYKMWAAIKDSQPSISPGRAVGFLFIPVFNIYWALLMLTGFTEDYNSFVIRRSIRAEKLSMTLFLIYAVLFMSAAMFVTIPMMCVFPFTGLINRAFDGYALASWVLVFFVSAAGIGHFITYIFVASKTCNAVKALAGK